MNFFIRFNGAYPKHRSTEKTLGMTLDMYVMFGWKGPRYALDVGSDNRVREQILALGEQAVPVIIVRVSGHHASLRIFPKKRKEIVAQWPACHCQIPDDRWPFYVLLLHGPLNPSGVGNSLDEISVVVQVGEDFEEQFQREFENYETQVKDDEPKHLGGTKPEHSLPLIVWGCGVRCIPMLFRRAEAATLRVTLGGIAIIVVFTNVGFRSGAFSIIARMFAPRSWPTAAFHLDKAHNRIEPEKCGHRFKEERGIARNELKCSTRPPTLLFTFRKLSQWFFTVKLPIGNRSGSVFVQLGEGKHKRYGSNSYNDVYGNTSISPLSEIS
jgi:hypothetical protein